jgi:hypothetical protein
MATYREIQERVKFTNRFVPKTCWIAHVMADHGLTTRTAANRINKNQRKYPCPDDKRSAIVTALRHFKML